MRTRRPSLLAACSITMVTSLVAPAPAHGAAPAVVTLTNPTAIDLGDGAPVGPYPSTIELGGPSLPLTRVEVVLHGVTHGFPPELRLMLVGPTGTAVVLAREVGSGGPLDDATVRFADGAPLWNEPGANTYSPTDNDSQGQPSPFAAPAPPTGSAPALSGFTGTNPVGTWSLFAYDGIVQVVGTIAGGWSLEVTVPSDLCLDLEDDGFADVPEANVHESAIDCISAFDIARGTSATTFNPSGNVSRGQMATFVANVLAAGGVPVPANAPDAFGDDDGTTHERATNGLVAAGVVGGNGESGSSFFPSGDMRRDHMASFMFEAFEAVAGEPLAPGPDAFADDDGNPHEGAINALAAVGVVSGTGEGTFNPAGTVSRAQMASFLARLLLQLDAAGAIA